MAIDWDSMTPQEHAQELTRGLESRERKIALLMSPTEPKLEDEQPRRRGRPAEKFPPAAPSGQMDGNS